MATPKFILLSLKSFLVMFRRASHPFLSYDTCHFNMLCKTPMAIHKQVISWSRDFRITNLVHRDPTPALVVNWCAPPWGYHKLNVDASYISSSSQAWCGIVA